MGAILPILANVAVPLISAGISAAIRRRMGEMPDPLDFLPKPGQAMEDVAALSRRTMQEAATAQSQRAGETAADLRAAGVIGTGLSAGMIPVYNAGNNLYTNILANMAQQQAAAKAQDRAYETQLGQLSYQRAADMFGNRVQAYGNMLTAGQQAAEGALYRAFELPRERQYQQAQLSQMLGALGTGAIPSSQTGNMMLAPQIPQWSYSPPIPSFGTSALVGLRGPETQMRVNSAANYLTNLPSLW